MAALVGPGPSPPPPRAFAARARGDPPGTPARRSRARRPPCCGRLPPSGQSPEPARPQLSAHSFPTARPALKQDSFWPSAAAVRPTSCVFLVRHQDAPAGGPGSRACPVGCHPGCTLCRPRAARGAGLGGDSGTRCWRLPESPAGLLLCFLVPKALTRGGDGVLCYPSTLPSTSTNAFHPLSSRSWPPATPGRKNHTSIYGRGPACRARVLAALPDSFGLGPG